MTGAVGMPGKRPASQASGDHSPRSRHGKEKRAREQARESNGASSQSGQAQDNGRVARPAETDGPVPMEGIVEGSGPLENGAAGVRAGPSSPASGVGPEEAAPMEVNEDAAASSSAAAPLPAETGSGLSSRPGAGLSSSAIAPSPLQRPRRSTSYSSTSSTGPAPTPSPSGSRSGGGGGGGGAGPSQRPSPPPPSRSPSSSTSLAPRDPPTSTGINRRRRLPENTSTRAQAPPSSSGSPSPARPRPCAGSAAERSSRGGPSGGGAAVAVGSSSQGPPVEEDRQFSCPLCWELLARPCTLPCGFTLCQVCVARLLQRAWRDGQANGAVCPVLGPDCPRGRVRELPSVNVMLHDQLTQLYPQAYAERLAEVDSAANARLIQSVKTHRTSGLPRPPLNHANPRNQGLNPAGPNGGRPQRGVLQIILNAALPRPVLNRSLLLRRLLPPYLLTLVLCLCLRPSPDQRYVPLRTSNVAWGLMTSSDVCWMAASTLSHCSHSPYPLLQANLSLPARDELMKLQSWGGLLYSRAKLLADMDLYHRLLGSFALSCSVLQLLSLYLTIAASRVRRLRAKGHRAVSIVGSEGLVLVLTWAAIEYFNVCLWGLVQVSPLKCFVVYRLPCLGPLLWSMETLWFEFTGLYRLITGVIPELSMVRQAEGVLDSLEDSPWYAAVLKDPRIMLISRRQSFWFVMIYGFLCGLWGVDGGRLLGLPNGLANVRRGRLAVGLRRQAAAPPQQAD